MVHRTVKMSMKIVKLEDILKKRTKSPDGEKNLLPSKQKTQEEKNDKIYIPKGLPVSGRVWKAPKKKFSSIIKTRGYKAANKFEKLQVRKQEVNRMRDLSRSIVEEKTRQKEEKKERRRVNLKRKEENRLKSEIVQVIKNPAKIKRMRKKQLRKIEKRDTLNMKKQ